MATFLHVSRTVLFGWLSLILTLCVEAYLWTKKGDASVIKAIRFHVYAGSVIGIFFACRYLWKKLNLLITKISVIQRIYQLLLLAWFGLVIVTIPLGQTYVQTEPPLILKMGNFLLGVALFLTLILLTMATVSFILRKSLLRNNEKRKETKVNVLFAILLTIAVTMWGSLRASTLHVEYIAIPIKNLPHRLNGTTIVQLSDIHLGPFIGQSRMEYLVERANELNGDMIMITGDLADSDVTSLWYAVKPLEKLNSKHGIYFCTGNHDYYTGDVDNWIEKLPSLNVIPLINDRICLFATKPNTSNCTDGLYVAGLEDIDTRRIRYGHHSMDIHKALSGRTAGRPTIVLAHQPKAAYEAIYWNDVMLVLSGHTHGGQILPLALPVYLFNPFFAGLYEPFPNVYVHVSAGTNYYLLPFRHYRPEITHLTLISI